MASEDYVPLSGEGEQYEVIDEVTNTESEGEDDGTEKGKILLQGSKLFGRSETHKEMQLSLGNEVLSEHNISEESTKQAQNMGEETSTVHTEDANITKEFPQEQVVGVENSSEVNRSVSKMSDKLEITGGLNEMDNEYENNERKSCNHQSSFVNTEKIKNEDVKFVQSVTATVPENSKKVDMKTISTKAKQDNESEKKIEGIKPKSPKEIVKAPCTDDQPKRAIPSDLNVLLVGGLNPGQSGVSEAISEVCEHCMGPPTTMLALLLVSYQALALPCHLL
jgi:hypothetical protein